MLAHDTDSSIVGNMSLRFLDRPADSAMQAIDSREKGTRCQRVLGHFTLRAGVCARIMLRITSNRSLQLALPRWGIKDDQCQGVRAIVQLVVSDA